MDTVNTFRQVGARVTAHYNSKIGDLADIKGIVALQADVRDESSVSKLLAEAAEKNGGPVSVLVVNHGMYDERSSLFDPLTSPITVNSRWFQVSGRRMKRSWSIWT